VRKPLGARASPRWAVGHDPYDFSRQHTDTDHPGPPCRRGRCAPRRSQRPGLDGADALRGVRRPPAGRAPRGRPPRHEGRGGGPTCTRVCRAIDPVGRRGAGLPGRGSVDSRRVVGAGQARRRLRDAMGACSRRTPRRIPRPRTSRSRMRPVPGAGPEGGVRRGGGRDRRRVARAMDSDAMRSPGMFGPEVIPQATATPLERLVAFLGRRP